jgi:hypothetical protein
MSDLANEAYAIITELSLLELLRRFGDARLVGSVPLDLIVKLDIDIHVLVSNRELLITVDSIYHRLFENEQIREVRISDYRPEGVKIGIDSYPGVSGDWSIDIWVTSQVEYTGFSFLDRLERELLPGHRSTIMEIKRSYHHQGLLRDGISMQIYRAVLDDEVRSVKKFHHYLEEQDQEMDST